MLWVFFGGAPLAYADSSAKPFAKANQVTVTLDASKPWKLGDQVCFSRNSIETSCGKVISIQDGMATVELTTERLGVKRVEKPKPKPAVAKPTKPKPVAPAAIAKRGPPNVNVVGGKGVNARTEPDKNGNVNIYLSVEAPESSKKTDPKSPEAPPPARTEIKRSLASRPESSRVIRVHTGLGIAWDGYTETGRPDYEGLGPAISAGVTIPVGARTFLRGESYLFLFPFAKSTTQAARPFSVSMGVEHILGRSNGFRLSGELGGFFNGMLVDQSAFGIRNVLGPYAGANVRIALNRQSELVLGAQFGPILGSVRSFGGSYRLTSTIGWRREIGRDRVVCLSADLTKISLQLDPSDGNLRSLTLNAALEW